MGVVVGGFGGGAFIFNQIQVCVQANKNNTNDKSIFILNHIRQGLRCCRKLCKFCQQNFDASQDALILVHNSSFEGQHAKDSEYV